jgi:hypothetical protein
MERIWKLGLHHAHSDRDASSYRYPASYRPSIGNASCKPDANYSCLRYASAADIDAALAHSAIANGAYSGGHKYTRCDCHAAGWSEHSEHIASERNCRCNRERYGQRCGLPRRSNGKL